MNDLERAKEELSVKNYTCVIINGTHMITSKQRGIAPLMEFYEKGADLRGYSAADKVVGKAAAYLYVRLGVREVYALVISQPALNVLNRFNIAVSYEMLVPAIRNRTNTGFCPMESAVLDIDNEQEAYVILKQKIKQLQIAEDVIKMHAVD